MKTCKYCAETDLQDEAKVCKHCGKTVVDSNDEAASKVSADRLTGYNQFFIYVPIVYGTFKILSGDFGFGIFFILVGIANRYYFLNEHKKKIVAKSAQAHSESQSNIKQ